MSELLSGVTEEEPLQRLAKVRQQAQTQSSRHVLSEFRKGEPLGVLALDDLDSKEGSALLSGLAARVHRAAEMTLLDGKYDHSVHSRYDVSRHSERVQRATGVDISRHTDKSKHNDKSRHKDKDPSRHLDRSRHSAAAAAAAAGVGAVEAVSQSVMARSVSTQLSHSLFAHYADGAGAASPKAGATFDSVKGEEGEEPEVSISAVAGPVAFDMALSGLEDDLLKLLGKGTAVELWHENRYASLERYLGFLVLFHSMAQRVATFAPLRFDCWRSQSQLRVATTAAPISAAEVVKEWAHDKQHHECFPLRHASPDHTGHGVHLTVAAAAALGPHSTHLNHRYQRA